MSALAAASSRSTLGRGFLAIMHQLGNRYGYSRAMRFLTSAQLSGFRCYEESEPIELEHLNLFVGRNNAGKSALMLAIRRLMSVELQRHPRVANPWGAAFLGPSTYLKLAAGDRRAGAVETRFVLTVGTDAARVRGDIEGLTLPCEINATFDGRHGTILQSAGATFDPNTKSVRADMHSAVRMLAKLPIVVMPENRGLHRATSLRAPEQVDVREERIDADQLLPMLLHWHCSAPDRLVAWRDRASRVLDESIAVRIVPSDEALEIDVGGDGFRRIESLGAGVVGVLSYALAVTAHDGGLLLYEEPELHLHTAMQRRLVEDLYQACIDGNWQAMVTTHSNHVVDVERVPGIALFEVRRENGVSSIKPMGSNAGALRKLVVGLGARPSSLLQANAILWVEGPSDAIYLRFFLAKAMTEVGIALRYETDFAFAFFGGSLLSHERLTDAPVDALMKLLTVHGNSFVVIDSDRAANTDELGKQYAREFIEHCEYPERLWVTNGREVENYLHPRIAMWAAGGSPTDPPPEFNLDAHGVFSAEVARLRHLLGRGRAAHDASDGNKTAFAMKAVQLMDATPGTDWLERLDLRARLHDLIAFIHKCSGRVPDGTAATARRESL